MQDTEQEECDHHWLTDVQLGDFVECEICGLIFPKTELKHNEIK